jgi:hypothetical protein
MVWHTSDRAYQRTADYRPSSTSDRRDVSSVLPPVTAFNHSVYVALRRCSRRHYGTNTKLRCRTTTAPTTCVSRGTSLVGHHHPSLWTLLGALQQDEALSATAILQEARGQPPVKRIKRSTQQLQARLVSLCTARRDKAKTMVEMLQGIGHLIRF